MLLAINPLERLQTSHAGRNAVFSTTGTSTNKGVVFSSKCTQKTFADRTPPGPAGEDPNHIGRPVKETLLAH